MITVSIFFYFLFLLLLVTGFNTTREFLYLICTHTKCYTSKLASTAMVYLPLVETVLNIEKYYFEHRVVTMM